MITTHPAYSLLEERAKKEALSIHKGERRVSIRPLVDISHLLSVVLDDLLESLRIENGVESYTELVKDMHFYPDLHGKVAVTIPI